MEERLIRPIQAHTQFRIEGSTGITFSNTLQRIAPFMIKYLYIIQSCECINGDCAQTTTPLPIQVTFFAAAYIQLGCICICMHMQMQRVSCLS